MHVLLTNDDGIAAPGLQALENAVKQLGWQYSIVAPATEQSQCGHRVTTHQPLRVETLADNRHAVHGTPADCVRLLGEQGVGCNSCIVHGNRDQSCWKVER